MRRIDAVEVNDNFIRAIGSEWMLITAGSLDSFNMMTASWGTVGYLWNKPVAIIFVRPERYTYEFLEGAEAFTLAFLGEEGREAHGVCGSQSGRDVNKAGVTGLVPCVPEPGCVSFEQARLTLVCRKLYADFLRPECFIDKAPMRWYGAQGGGFHKVYIAEIEGAYVR